MAAKKKAAKKNAPIITKEILEAAPAWTVFHGNAADPGRVHWELFQIEPGDYGFVDDPAHDLEALGVEFTEPQLDSERRQPAGSSDHDAALAYLRSGGTLCKVPDAPGSPYWRLLVVDQPKGAGRPKSGKSEEALTPTTTFDDGKHIRTALVIGDTGTRTVDVVDTKGNRLCEINFFLFQEGAILQADVIDVDRLYVKRKAFVSSARWGRQELDVPADGDQVGVDFRKV